MDAPTTPPALTITLFGPMNVLVEGCPLPPLRSRKALWLLALLALRGGRAVEREWLAETLWPDHELESALASLRVALSDVRRALGGQSARLQNSSRRTVVLDVAGTDIDALAFDAAAKSRELSILDHAVVLYRGTLLEGCAEEWVGQERAAREQNCLRALTSLADAALAVGDYETAVRHYRKMISLDPWREEARRGLMEALSRGGNVNAALHVYREFARLLRDDPRAAPDEETTAIYTRLRFEARRQSVPHLPEEAMPASSSEPSISGYLPNALTDLVGREVECKEVAEALTRSRLVTLTGPGGIGKTRLAAAVAEDVAGSYPDGVWLVALDALSNGTQIPARVAGVIGMKEEAARAPLAALSAHLRAKRLLLVLDNCEHVLEACAQIVGHLLRECAGIRVLATSRELLGIMGETSWMVPSLPVPDPAHLPTEASLMKMIAGYAGVRLFIERAQRVQQTFALTEENAKLIAQICARLEGIPLALELAAARARVMTASQMAARLDDHLGLLTGGDSSGPSRQRTLRATLDWSYALLSDSEQILLRRLSVFAGGWTNSAAEAICSGEGVAEASVFDLLTRLVDKSLVIFEERDGVSVRYRLLEMVRQYAAETLNASGEAGTVLAKHRDWFLSVATAKDFYGADAKDALQLIQAESDNMRQVLDFCSRDPDGAEPGLRLVAALAGFWAIRGSFVEIREGRQYIDRALAHPKGGDFPDARSGTLRMAARLSASLDDFPTACEYASEMLHLEIERGNQSRVAMARMTLGNIHHTLGEYDLSQAHYEESLAIFRESGVERNTAWALSALAGLARDRGDYRTAQTLDEQVMAIRRRGDDRQSLGFTLISLGTTMQRQGDYVSAQALLEEGIALFRDLQDRFHLPWALVALGRNAFYKKDYRAATAYVKESLLIVIETASLRIAGEALSVMSAILAAQDSPEKAALLLASSAALLKSVHVVLSPVEREDYEQEIEALRITLGTERFARYSAEGTMMKWQQAVNEAFHEDLGIAPAQP